MSKKDKDKTKTKENPDGSTTSMSPLSDEFIEQTCDDKDWAALEEILKALR